MKKILLFLAIFFPAAAYAGTEFPSEPFRIVVYTAPGGLIDITARKLADILQKEKIVPVPVIVENKKGAGGLIALHTVLHKPADGYVIFGFTSSVISKIVQAKQEKKLGDLHFLARVVTDYECLITRKNSGLDSLKTIKAKALAGRQIWAGPAAGGTDHIFAMKTWDAIGVKGVWIPYRSGGEAIAALLGGHADVYVGNPQDVSGRPGLQVIAIASPERLPEFKSAPTFSELTYEELTGEMLWRGFAVRKGVPEEHIGYLENVIKKATETTEWKTFLLRGNTLPSFDTGEAFRTVAMKQADSDRTILEKAIVRR